MFSMCSRFLLNVSVFFQFSFSSSSFVKKKSLGFSFSGLGLGGWGSSFSWVGVRPSNRGWPFLLGVGVGQLCVSIIF